MFRGTRVRFVVTCETCDSEMSLDVVVYEHDPDGTPVLHADMVLSQASFECDLCGSITYTGDFADMCFHEPGELDYDDEEEEE